MSDLISRSALIEELQKYFVNNSIHKNDLAEIIANQPIFDECTLDCKKCWKTKLVNASIVEAVPVVHCKDCEHWGMGVAGETEYIKCCEYGKYMVGENGYCVYGKKVQE